MPLGDYLSKKDQSMKKYLWMILAVLMFSMQSCYIDDTTPCIPIVDYQSQRCFYNYPYPITVEVYFYQRCENYGTRYSLLVQDNVYGTEFINGRYWRFASGPSRFSPTIAYADYRDLAPNRTYRAIILSDYGTLSEEFYLYTY